MSFKEHLQFLVMMIPTLLLLIAAAVTLAVPGASGSGNWSVEPTAADSYASHELVVVDGDASLQPTVAVR